MLGVVILCLIFIPTTASGFPPLDLKSRGGLGRYRLQHTFASTLGEVDSAQPKTEGFIQISANFLLSPPIALRNHLPLQQGAAELNSAFIKL